jgi:hypothetical protein
MATRAEEYRSEMQRSGAKKDKKRAKSNYSPPRLTHNDAPRADRKSTYAIEETGARASRKSTRSSSNRAKPDSALRITARIRSVSPKARSER